MPEEDAWAAAVALWTHERHVAELKPEITGLGRRLEGFAHRPDGLRSSARGYESVQPAGRGREGPQGRHCRRQGRASHASMVPGFIVALDIGFLARLLTM
jgi:hypothetical protein